MIGSASWRVRQRGAGLTGGVDLAAKHHNVVAVEAAGAAVGSHSAHRACREGHRLVVPAAAAAAGRCGGTCHGAAPGAVPGLSG